MRKINLKAVLNTQRPKAALPNQILEKEDFEYPVRIRMTIQRVVTFYSCGFFLKAAQLENGFVVNHTMKALYNAAITKKIHDITTEMLEEFVGGEALIKKKAFLNLKFDDYAQKIISRVKGTQAGVTISHKEVYLRKFNAFAPGIKLKEITKDVLAKYEERCLKKSMNNTVWGATKFVKTILNAAVEDGIFQQSPALGYKGVKYINPERDSLSAEEITKFEVFADNQNNNATLRHVAAWFIFGCYCGLRYGDMQKFKTFKNGKITMLNNKTKEPISIFATKKIKEANERITGEIFSNQKCNMYLRIIKDSLEINKRVGMHTARHTFAVQFLERGGRIEFLSQSLGHKSIKTTQIYAKISTPASDAEMKKVWDKD